MPDEDRDPIGGPMIPARRGRAPENIPPTFRRQPGILWRRQPEIPVPAITVGGEPIPVYFCVSLPATCGDACSHGSRVFSVKNRSSFHNGIQDKELFNEELSGK